MKSAISVRASSFGALFDCAYKWEAQHIMGLSLPSSARAHLGTAIHHGTAVFDQSRISNPASPIPAIEACREFLTALRMPDYEVDWSSSDIGKREAESIGVLLVNRYCTEISPHYQFSSVEMQTQPLDIDCRNGITVTLTGTLDRSRVIEGLAGFAICDIKTGKQASKGGVAKTAGHKPQIGTYELLFEHSTGQRVTEPAEIIGLCTGKPDVGIGQITDASRLLLGDDDNLGYIEMAAEIFRTGLFTPNPQSRLCSKTYCPRWKSCIYHD